MRMRLSLSMKKKSMDLLRGLAIVAALSGGLTAEASAQAGMTAQPPPQQDAQDTMAQSTAREADLTDQQARAHYTVGVAMYDAGRFQEAATEFQAAYDLSHRPQLLYNCYVAYRDSSQATRARDSLTQYLAEVPDAPNRLHLMARLEALNTEIAAAEAAAAEQEAQRLAAEQAARDAALAQQAAEHQAEQLTHVRPWWPWVVFGTGVVAVSSGVGVGVWNNDRAAGIRTNCGQQDGTLGCQRLEFVTQREDILLIAGVADTLWIAGAAATGVGLLLALLVPDDIVDTSSPIDTTGTTASCTTDGCYASLSLRW